MPFIDWNGNGNIDPSDIAINIALDEENNDSVSTSEPRRKHGCLTSIVTVMTGIALITFIFMR